MGVTSPDLFPYPEGGDSVDVPRDIKALAEAIQGNITRGTAKTYFHQVVQDTHIATTRGPYGGPLTLTVPAPRSQVFIATTTFDMVNDGGQPGYSASGLGYMDLDGVNLATFASFRGGLGTGASAACTWIGVLQPGNHSFQMFVNSDTWAAIHIFSATLTVAVVS